MRVAHTDAARAQQSVGDHAHRAALADDADRTIGRRHLGEHGREARHSAVAEIRHALRVGPDDAHAAGAGAGRHRLFARLTVRVTFAEAGAHHDAQRYAGYSARIDRLDGQFTRQRDYHHIGHLGQRLQAGETAKALHLGARRVDRIHHPFEAKARQIGQRPAADFVGVIRGADHGDGSRRQRQAQRRTRVAQVERVKTHGVLSQSKAAIGQRCCGCGTEPGRRWPATARRGPSCESLRRRRPAQCGRARRRGTRR